MSTRIVPVPDRFGVRRTGEPDRLAPPIAVPTGPETAPAPGPALPSLEPAPAPDLVPAEG